MFYQLLPSTSVGNEYGQQMRIQILILGFEGLRLDVHTISDSAYIYSGTKTILDRDSGFGAKLLDKDLETKSPIYRVSSVPHFDVV